MKKTILLSLFLGLLFGFSPVLTAKAVSVKVPVPGRITMVDLGAHSCIPCKMMMPIINKLTVDYKDKVAIIFIDVWENKEQAKQFKVAAIPTQIFFAEDGREVYRHQGFMAEEAIVQQLTNMGVALPEKE